MARRDIVAIGLVVVQFTESVTSALPRILPRAGALPATHPENEFPIHAGRIYVAPPDCHLSSSVESSA